MTRYELMHKDQTCGILELDEDTGRVASYKDLGTGRSPFLGNADVKKIRKWWEMRAIPASRDTIQDILRKAGCFTPGSYLAKNLALSMTDAYWIRPEGMEALYSQVKFSNSAGFYNGKVPYHNATSYDPNASLGGQMAKYWDLATDPPTLVKESYKAFGQQSANEVFAAHLHRLQHTDIPFVEYTAEITEDRGILCRCEAFTDDHREFIPAYEVLESQKNPNDMAPYDFYIELCVAHGIDREAIQDFMDYQTMTDFVISNTDEHLQNFGVLRDPVTMKLIGPAPVFDSGNSMFYADGMKVPYTRAGILDRKITSFYKKEEQMLEKVKDRSLVRADLLPSPSEVRAIYEDAGLPQWKAKLISANYATKCQLFSEFQRGKTISYHKEKTAGQPLQEKPPQEHPGQQFVMVCGIPGSGKTEQAEKLLLKFQEKGHQIKNQQELYPGEKVCAEAGFFFDKSRVMGQVTAVPGYEGSVVRISANEIRKEIEQLTLKPADSLVFALAGARMKAAFLSGASVIYEASNLDKHVRQEYTALAEECGVKDRTLCVMHVDPKHSKADIPVDKLIKMDQRLKGSSPSIGEGWSSVQDIKPVRNRTRDTWIR